MRPATSGMRRMLRWNDGVRRGAVAAAVLGLCSLSCSMASAAGDAKAPETFRDCANCPEMVVLPPGQFLMGSTEEEAGRELASIEATPLFYRVLGWNDRERAAGFMQHERPQHLVTIPNAFAIGRFPVTVEQFAAFVSETGHDTGPCRIPGPGRPKPPVSSAWDKPGFRQDAHAPVVCVTWEDAKAYAHWLNAKVTGGTAPATGEDGPYRLPSEAEWEYAARAGTRTARWWGESIGSGFAWCDGCNRGPEPVGAPWSTWTVDGHPPNPFGLYDMLGNVTEMTVDCWHDSYAGAPIDGSAWLDGTCARRTDRGSNWHGSSWTARSASRGDLRPDEGSNGLGFRLVKVLQGSPSEKQPDKR